MPGKESSYPLDWFKKGDSDLNSAEILLQSENLDTAAFHIQQAIEKYLKGFLLSRGWSLIKTHDLIDLLNEAISREPLFEDFRQLCMRATEYYIEDRYPFMITSDLNKEELSEVFEETKKFLRLIKENTGEL